MKQQTFVAGFSAGAGASAGTIGYQEDVAPTLKGSPSGNCMDNLQLEESEYALIRDPQRGSCLYKCGNERYLLQVQAPEYKQAIFGTAGGR